MFCRITFLLFVFCTNSCSIFGEPSLTSRFAVPWLLRQTFGSHSRPIKTSNIMDSASEYLEKFGWFEPTDWVAVSPRSDEMVAEGRWSVVDANRAVTERQQLNVTSAAASSLSSKDFAAALRSFQKANGLLPTGVLDATTMSVMNRLRCGVPDHTMRNNRSLEYPQVYSSKYNYQTGINSNGNTWPHRRTLLSALHRRRRRGAYLIIKYNSVLHPLIFNSHENKGQKNSDDRADLNYDIFEDEFANYNRLKDIENVWKTLRRETTVWEIESPKKNFISRIASESVATRRRKRSELFRDFQGKGGWGMAFNKKTITWRLVREWPTLNNQHLTKGEIWFTLKLAFRIWSEVFPRNFQEDTHSLISNVDILIGFGTKRHNRCPVQFKSGSFTREFAHAWALPKAEIHFNDAQTFVPVNYLPTKPVSQNNAETAAGKPISFLKVAIHEIGHALGLFHSENRVSIMNPYYQPFQEQQLVELSVSDRESIKSIYGTCDVTFDAVFDWVRQTRNANGAITWRYNTYFFRRSWYWLYENRVLRPRYGDPRLTTTNWRGVLGRSNERIDGVVHIRSWNSLEGPTFFFKGNVYFEYDSANGHVKTRNARGQTYPRLISTDFPGVPHPIDTVVFKFDEDLLYFFKNLKVYRFRWRTKTLLDSSLISVAFPGWGGSPPLPDNIDAAYYSYTYQAYYFLKGVYYWKLADERERLQNNRVRIPYNAVGPRQKIASKWRYLCDVGPSELILNLPTT